ncbi:MAG TPA: alpha/beta hydrolase-fold protein, partial [Acidimicrobiales bacterium]|nr:alpha/beta hydrolase-fold protein [Acidimicrobiales bacterium]
DLTDAEDLLGPGISVPFEYYVPPACTEAARCPVLYLLHGFGGSYTEMLGTPGTRPESLAWIAAETKEPPAGFESDPWNYSDPDTWVSAPSALDMILVAPLGQTLPGGYGPSAGLDSYWVNWNPRYAQGGDEPRYDTPAPQFATFVTQELPSFVDTYLPAGEGRQFSAIAGVSLGGYGAYDLALQHPDLYAAMLSVSGAMNFLFAPAPQPGLVTLPAGIQPPIPVVYVRLPALTGAATKVPLPSEVGSFATALTALGDPVADEAYFRGNMPTDLAMNARAYGPTGSQELGIDDFWNDMVPTQGVQQLLGGGGTGDLQNDVSSEPFENIVFPMNVDMELAFSQQGVQNTFAIHQGNHSDTYRNAWFRGLEEFAYARLSHPGSPLTASQPSRFDYRTISTDFTIWGWHVTVHRTPVEFLTMRSVSCTGLSLQGTGTVTVTVPASCGTGLRGATTFSVDLGPDQLTDEPADLSATGLYGRTVTVALTPLAA